MQNIYQYCLLITLTNVLCKVLIICMISIYFMNHNFFLFKNFVWKASSFSFFIQLSKQFVYRRFSFSQYGNKFSNRLDLNKYYSSIFIRSLLEFFALTYANPWRWGTNFVDLISLNLEFYSPYWWFGRASWRRPLIKRHEYLV